MKCYVSTDVGTWTNWWTFEPDPDYSLDAGTGLLSLLSYMPCYAEFYVGKIRRIRIGRCSQAWFKMVLWPTTAVTHGFTMVSLTEAVTHWNTFVGGRCTPPSNLLVCVWICEQNTFRTVSQTHKKLTGLLWRRFLEMNESWSNESKTREACWPG